MKKLSLFLAIFGSLMFCFPTNATITSMTYADDGDGAIICPVYVWDGNTNVLSMSGDLFWGPAHILGTIDTDTALDPTLLLSSAIDNDTTFAWTAFLVNVYMSNSFSISAVTVSNVPYGDWTVLSYTGAASPIGGGIYMGQMVFTNGTPVTIGGELDFSYKITFSGLTQYAFCQEMIPVPEPGALGLMTLGGLLLGGLALKRRGNR
jgi:hypothetical protein